MEHIAWGNCTEYHPDGPSDKVISTGPPTYEGWNFNSGNYLFTTDTK